MDLNTYLGRRVRLKADAPIGQKVVCYLTDEQVAHGPEGIVMRAVAADEGLLFDVDLENVPTDHLFPAEACILIDSDLPR